MAFLFYDWIPQRTQHIHRIAAKAANGFCQDLVNSLFAALCYHPTELKLLFLIQTYGSFQKYSSIFPIRVSRDQL